jgi:hypothetical protein
MAHDIETYTGVPVCSSHGGSPAHRTIPNLAQSELDKSSSCSQRGLVSGLPRASGLRPVVAGRASDSAGRLGPGAASSRWR